MAQTDETQVSWQDYLAIVNRRRTLFLVPLITIIVVTMIVGLFLPKIYKARSVVLVENPELMNPLLEDLAIQTSVEHRLRIVTEELLGWQGISRLVKRLGMDREIKNASEMEELVAELQKDIQITLTARRSLITLTYKHSDPHHAREVLNTLTEIYVERNIERQTEETETAIRFIESEMTVYRAKLEESEVALREFKELHAMQMPVAARLNQQIMDLEIQLAQLLVENTDEHPTVIRLRRQVNELKRARNSEIRKVITRAVTTGRNPEIYADLAAALEEEVPSNLSALSPKAADARHAYEAWVERMDSSSMSVVQSPGQGASGTPGAGVFVAGLIDTNLITLGPRQEQELVRLQRDYNVYRNTYDKMIRRLELAKVTQRVSASEQGTKFKMLEEARLPLSPHSPDLGLFLLGSILAGILVGLGFVFGVEYFDDSFVTVADLQETLSLPVLGTISKIVTQEDIEQRNDQLRQWVSGPGLARAFGEHFVRPVKERVDLVLKRWGM